MKSSITILLLTFNTSIKSSKEMNIHKLCWQNKLETLRETLRSIARNKPMKLKSLVNQRDEFDKTPLYIACILGNIKMVKLLIKNGASVNAIHEGYSLLHERNVHTSIPLIKVLLSAGIDITRTKPNGDTILHTICLYGTYEALEYILQCFSEIKPNLQSKMPLDLTHDHKKIELLKNKIDLRSMKRDVISRRVC